MGLVLYANSIQSKILTILTINIKIYSEKNKDKYPRIIFKQIIMTKADIVLNISDDLGLDRADVQATVENFMKEIKSSLEKGENVYLRGFGSFIIKTRAEKTGRNISKNIAIKIPAHNIPAFKPAKIFTHGVKSKVAVSK